jgi:hypothetical protein
MLSVSTESREVGKVIEAFTLLTVSLAVSKSTETVKVSPTLTDLELGDKFNVAALAPRLWEVTKNRSNRTTGRTFFTYSI